jgi:hypothetical protein
VTIIPDEIKHLNVEQIDFNNHEFLKNLMKLLLNVIESQSQIIVEKKKDIQSPNVEKKKVWSKTAKKPSIKIDRTEVRRVDRDILPPDAENKGYRTVVVQNIKFSTDNVEY